MTREHHQRFVFILAGNLRHQQWRLPPAGIDLRMQHDFDRLITLHAVLQRVTIRLAQAQDDRGRQVDGPAVAAVSECPSPSCCGSLGR